MISSLVALTASASVSVLASQVQGAFDWLYGLQQPHTSFGRLEEFIAYEEPFAWSRILRNIGPDGCNALGVSPGVVVASPERDSPDYFYTWTRDAALVIKLLVEELSDKYSPKLQEVIQDYILAQAKVQCIRSRSGNLDDGFGLGEPKFTVHLDPFQGDWGRPQRDGPALRAITLLSYARWLLHNGYNETAINIVWPVIHNDLSYVGEYWANHGFDLWEEVDGLSFFTLASQHRALVEGNNIAKALGRTCDACNQLVPFLSCSLGEFWSGDKKYIVANVDTNIGRTGLDTNTILASIHSFDPSAGCDDSTFQPCSDKALANHRAVTNSFRGFYPIDESRRSKRGVSIGRYMEDVYMGGNPWYLTTLAAAEQLYDALIVWNQQGYVDVTPLSLSFFRDVYPDVTLGRHRRQSSTYSILTDEIRKYADEYLDIVAEYVQNDGSLSEQFSKTTGQPVSARDLTWSYAAFLSAIARRRGRVPPSWIDGAALSDQAAGDGAATGCQTRSLPGTYRQAPTTATFPPHQTPRNGGHRHPTDAPPAPPRPTGRPSPETVALTFDELASTRWGETVLVVGNVSELGEWNVQRAIPLSADRFTQSRPRWIGRVKGLRPGQVMEYKFVKTREAANGGTEVEWEADPNHTLTVPAGCETEVVVSGRWQTREA